MWQRDCSYFYLCQKICEDSFGLQAKRSDLSYQILETTVGGVVWKWSGWMCLSRHHIPPWMCRLWSHHTAAQAYQRGCSEVIYGASSGLPKSEAQGVELNKVLFIGQTDRRKTDYEPLDMPNLAYTVHIVSCAWCLSEAQHYITRVKSRKQFNTFKPLGPTGPTSPLSP